MRKTGTVTVPVLQYHSDVVLPLTQLVYKSVHGLRNFDLLGADLLTTAAAHAGAGVLFLGDRHQGHGGNKPAVSKIMFVVELQQHGDV